MSNYETNQQRRRFLNKASTVVAAIPIASLVASRAAFADDAALVDENSGQAMALKYVAMSATDGQACENCALYQQADGVDGAGNCPLFQGSHVAAAAWCSAYSPKG